jgi:hypothetical protein
MYTCSSLNMSEVIQISVTSDGRLKAVYSNNDVLILSSAGSMFAYVANGQTARQTCEFAVSTYTAALCAAIEFRNMHLDSVVWCRALAKKHAKAVFKLGYPISFVTWPESLAKAIAADRLQVCMGCRSDLVRMVVTLCATMPTATAVQIGIHTKPPP